jgi:DNA segregation ATPase FtsK/SpoIIIE, S-DNA-T family
MSKTSTKTKMAKAASGRDERARKLLGILFIFTAIYLAIAFTSYFYTWKYDQDKVIHFTWSSFFESDLSVKNWLGRLGAYISNAFFYWGFGLPSMVFIVLFARLGLDMIRKKPLMPFFIMARNVLMGVAFMSLFLEFTFRSSEFTWGGAFGESTCFWLSNFVGTIGLFFLLMFTLTSFMIWKFNPNFDFATLGRMTSGDIKIENPFKHSFKNIFNFSSENTTKPDAKVGKAAKAESETLRPSHVWDSPKPIPKTGSSEQESDSSSFDFRLPATDATTKSRPVTSASGDLEMEIQSPAPADTPTSQGMTTVTQGYQQVEPDSQLVNKEELQEITQSASDEEAMSGPYDPTLDLRNYKYPHLNLLINYEKDDVEIDRAELEANKDQIIETLLNYNIEIIKIRATIGPTVTLYEIIPAPGVKISKIKNLEDDIALSLAALGIRIIAPIPGKGTIGIEVPNKKKHIVSLREVLESDKYKNSGMALPIALGKTISNEVFVADLAKMPHLLIAGATGQGKSVGINTVIMSLLYKKHPSEVKLVMIDPKKVELFPYAALEKHFLSFLPNEEEPIVTETSKVIYTLNSLCIEMDRRYDLLKAAKVRNLAEYNEKFTARKLNPLNGHEYLPYIVLVIDEFADLIMTAGKEVEMPIARLAQLARAIGIHLIIATQRPSVNIITGVIKANFPARLAFKVTSKIDSRTILDAGGAEQLIGRGDMLLSVGSSVVRLQCAFVDTPEIEQVIDFISEQQGFPEPFFLPEFKGDDDGGVDGNFSLSELDSNFEEAARLIVANQHGSTSMIQRKMQLGYNRAGRIMDQMEKLGIVGPAQGSKPREVLFYTVDEFDNYMQTLKNQ